MSQPLAEQLILALGNAPGGGFQFKPGALDSVREAADSLDSGEELYAVLQELVRFAGFLAGPKNSKAAADELLAIVEMLAGKLEQLARGDAQATRARSDDIARQARQQRQALSLESASDPGLPAPASGIGLRSGKLPRGGG